MRQRGGHSDRESVAAATLRLKMMLAGCTDVALGRFTVDGLVSTHRVSRKVAEYELQIARQRRAAA